jgi:hypothetical protein
MKRATLILRALHIAVKNDAHSSVKALPDHMVKQVPEYNEVEDSRAADGLVDLEVPYEASFGQDPRASKPQRAYKTPEEFEKQRAESIANYYGFPTVEAHAAAKRKGWTPYSQTHQATAESTTAHVGTAAIGCPGGPEVPVRSAAASSVVAPSALSPHHVTKPAASNPPNSGALSAPRKPPMPAKEVPASIKQVKAANATRRSAPQSNMA